MSELDWYDDRNLQMLWHKLRPNAREVLQQLCENGPTYDGYIASKSGRDDLLEAGYAARIMLKGMEWGYQAATYRGGHVYKASKLLPKAGAA